MNRRFARTIIFSPPAQGVGAGDETPSFGTGALVLALLGGAAAGAIAMYVYRQNEVHNLTADFVEMRGDRNTYRNMWQEAFDEQMEGREKISELRAEKSLIGRAADEYARDLREYERAEVAANAETWRETDAITLGRPPVRAGEMWASPEDIRAARRALGMKG